MMGLLWRVNQRCEAARQEGKSELAARQMQWIGKRHGAILAQTDTYNAQTTRHNKCRGRVKQFLTFDLISRLRGRPDAVLRVATNLRVPFTNNLGERAIRMPKVKQGLSGCFRALKGAQDFCAIRA